VPGVLVAEGEEAPHDYQNGALEQQGNVLRNSPHVDIPPPDGRQQRARCRVKRHMANRPPCRRQAVAPTQAQRTDRSDLFFHTKPHDQGPAVRAWQRSNGIKGLFLFGAHIKLGRLETQPAPAEVARPAGGERLAAPGCPTSSGYHSEPIARASSNILATARGSKRPISAQNRRMGAFLFRFNRGIRHPRCGIQRNAARVNKIRPTRARSPPPICPVFPARCQFFQRSRAVPNGFGPLRDFGVFAHGSWDRALEKSEKLGPADQLWFRKSGSSPHQGSRRRFGLVVGFGPLGLFGQLFRPTVRLLG